MDYWLISLTIESILCLLFSIALYFYFVRRDTNISVTLGSITVWFLTFVLIVFIPYDIYFFNYCEKNGLICNNTMIIYKSNNKTVNNTSEIDVDYIKNGIKILNILYAINYWLIFILSWLIIPIIKSYNSSGYFIHSEKLKNAIKENILFFIILIVVAIIGYIAICILFGTFINPLYLKNISIGLTLSWGLIQVFFFLGYSLVKLPKNLLTHYKYKNEKRFLEWEIQDLREYMKEIIVTDLVKLSLELKKTEYEFEKNDKNFPLYDYKQYFIKVKTKFDSNKPKRLEIIERGFHDSEIDYAKNMEELALLHQNVKSKLIDYERGMFLMTKKYKKWVLILSILTLKNKIKDEISINFELEKGIKYFELTKTKQIYYIYIKPIYKVSFALICILLEIITLYGEIFSSIDETFFSIMGNLITLTNNIVLVHFITLIQISFLFYLCLYTIFKMKVSFLCQMYGNRQTDSNSVLFVCNMMARIGFPICINFCQITGLTNLIISKNYGTGTMKSDDIYDGLNEAEAIYKGIIQFFPLILILLSILNFFNIFSKIGDCMGFNSFEIKNEDTEINIIEGKNILETLFQKYGLDSKIENDYLEKIIFNIK